jgi:hypothetical protein
MRQMHLGWMLGLVSIGILCQGCGLPRDPEGAYERVSNGVLRVGSIDNYPQVQLRNDAAPTGREARIVRELANSLNAKLLWVKGGEDELLRKLERFEIDLVIGGIREDTPWRERVALSQPYDQNRIMGETPHVLAGPPGENKWLLYVDRWVSQHQPEIAAILEETGM